MFFKKNIYLKISLLSSIISLTIPLFDPYYNLNLKNHIFLSLKIWLILTIIFFIIIYLVKKLNSNE